ncbi:MAG: ABC-F family ATP-binding cassette domain-containing protein, partial [Clostridia bacterium]|nr:ABC-F family ATP-binding cassette domain-containing protein [Clostridia bacterium]
IVMDEPDVFLDFENLNGMRDLINAYKGTVLVITHNRYLLNHCFNKIIHLENTALQEFNGSYAAYTLSLLEKKIDLQERAMADDEEIERNQIIIDNLRKIATYNKEAARGKALKARVKFQERLEARRIQAPFVDIQKPTIRLTIDAPIEDGIVLSLNDFNLAFDETLLENATFEIGAKDKVALIGTNGCGKTTLIRKIYENKTPTITLSPEAKTAYLSQVQGEMMNESNTILEEFYYGGFDTSDSVRRHLLPYGFDSDKIKQEISTLSGGEKNLLQIAKASANQANLLLLDEPTSHLDTYSQMALEEAIADFNGAVLMISHDYYTIINSMDYVLLIEDKSIRKMSMRKFRKMIYANHFNKDYLHLEEKKQDLESKIAFALKNYNFEQAKVWCEKLEELIPLL